MIEKRVGLKLRAMRKNAGMNQKTLARKSGVSVSYISDIERGAKMPSFKVVMLIVETLGYDIFFAKSGTTRVVL